MESGIRTLEGEVTIQFGRDDEGGSIYEMEVSGMRFSIEAPLYESLSDGDSLKVRCASSHNPLDPDERRLISVHRHVKKRD